MVALEGRASFMVGNPRRKTGPRPCASRRSGTLSSVDEKRQTAPPADPELCKAHGWFPFLAVEVGTTSPRDVSDAAVHQLPSGVMSCGHLS